MRRPVIGITANLEQAAWGAWSEPAAFVPANYVAAVQRAGGLAVVLAPDPLAEAEPAPFLAGLDGLLLSGGCDVDPSSYGASPHPQTRGTVPERDRFEIALAREAMARDIPLLGVCRGMQVLNVARGGTLVQHLPDATGHEEHRRHLGTFAGNHHDVRLRQGSRARAAAREDVHRVASHHHQGVDRLGEGLVVTGTSDLDALPEALEGTGGSWVLGVQWHPESDDGSQVIGGLVAEAAAYAAGRSTRSSATTGTPGAVVEAR